MMPDLTVREEQVLGVLRRADELWLPHWQIAKRAGLSMGQTRAAVRGLRARMLAVKRPSREGISRWEWSLVRSGL